MATAALFLVSFLFFTQSTTSQESSVVFDSPDGTLEGTTAYSRNGREFYSFRGVPYVEQPERFQASVPVKPWKGIRDAKKYGNPCPNFDPLIKGFIGEDDCLFLNVFTPVKQDKKKSGLPVMVWIYPGAFITGKSDDYEPHYFMDEDVILVTINYRMGPFGFLTTNDDVLPGNLGLKDQVQALKWVQRNVDSFGGDPSKVTIFGASAGGASVHYHILSEMSKGLFRNGISQSGNALAPWALQKDPIKTAEEFAGFLNCPSKFSKDLKECLKTKTVHELLQAQLAFNKWAIFPFNSFAPSVEPTKTPQSFLIDTPQNILESGNYNKYPWITGFAEDEGLVVSSLIIAQEKFLHDVNEDWARVLPISLCYEDTYEDKATRENVSNQILTHYFGNEEVSEETWEQLTHLFSDRYFIYSNDKAIRLQAKNSVVYPYEFAFPGAGDPSAVIKIFYGIDADHGVTHLDDLQYLFRGYWTSKVLTADIDHGKYEFSQKFVQLWISFAKDNKPIPTWGSVKWEAVPKTITAKDKVMYYQIAPTPSKTDCNIQDRMAFWEKLDVDQVKKGQKLQETKINEKQEL